MAFTYRLEKEDGTSADSPLLHTAVPTWQAGDTIPLGAGRTLRVIETRLTDEEPVLVVERGKRAGVRHCGLFRSLNGSDGSRRPGERSRVIPLALLPESRPEARRPPTRSSAREARSQGKQSSDLRGQHPCGAGGPIMARYMLRLKTQSEPDRTADFDAGEHTYEKGDVVDLAEDGLWRVEKVEPLDEPFLAELICVSFRAPAERKPTAELLVKPRAPS